MVVDPEQFNGQENIPVSRPGEKIVCWRDTGRISTLPDPGIQMPTEPAFLEIINDPIDLNEEDLHPNSIVQSTDPSGDIRVTAWFSPDDAEN